MIWLVTPLPLRRNCVPPRPGRAVVPLQIELRERLVAHVLQRDVVGLDGLARLLQIGALVERLAHRRLHVERLGKECRPIDRIDLRGPQRIVGAADDEPLQRELRRAPLRIGLRHGLEPRRGFGLRLHDVERRQRADLDARLVVLHELVGEILRPLGDVERVDRVDQLPVRVAHVGQRRGDGAAQLDLGGVAVERRDDELLAVVVDAEPAEQRLRHRQREVRVERRVVVHQVVRGDLLVVVELERRVAAAPGSSCDRPVL